MTTYKRISFVVPQELVGPIMELVAPEATELSLESVEAPTRRRKRGPHTTPIPERLTSRAILKHYALNKTFTLQEAAEWMESDGLSPNSASPSCSALAQTGYLERVDSSTRTYRFIRPPQAKATAVAS